MIREDRELLAELARLNGDMASLAMRMMEGRASAAEQQHYARRLIAAGDRLHRRAEETGGAVIDGDVVAAERPALPCASSPDGDTSSEPDWAP